MKPSGCLGNPLMEKNPYNILIAQLSEHTSILINTILHQVIKPTLSKWKESDHIQAVAAGEFHSLYLSNSGHLYSCGNNDVGQLGRQTESDNGKNPGNIKNNAILLKKYILYFFKFINFKHYLKY